VLDVCHLVLTTELVAPKLPSILRSSACSVGVVTTATARRIGGGQGHTVNTFPFFPNLSHCGTLRTMKAKKTEAIRVNVTPEQRTALEAVAAQEDVPIAHIIRRAIRLYLAGQETS
jgi:hypothetical protein